MRSVDIALISFFSGAAFIMLFRSLVGNFLTTNEIDPGAKEKWQLYEASIPTFRCWLMFVITLFLMSFSMYILRKYKVNYPFILEMDPYSKVTSIEIFRFALILLVILLFAMDDQFDIS